MLQITHETSDKAVKLTPVDKKGLSSFKEKAEAVFVNQLEVSQFEAGFATKIQLTGADGNLAQVLVGMEPSKSGDPRDTVFLFSRLGGSLPASLTYTVNPSQWEDLNWEQAAIGWGLASYKFKRYLKDGKEGKPAATLHLPQNLIDLEDMTHKVEAIALARDLVNTPANDLGPQELCDKVGEVAQACGATASYIKGEDLLKHNYPAVFAVGKGSFRPPMLADLRWGNQDHPKLTLVGKGVVFDTGGLNLKPGAGMVLMKKDMGGSAIVLALAQLIMKSKLPVNLRLLIPAVENSPGNIAYRPSDVIETRKKISVEIGNTDAEGRVILCDALTEAVSEEPDLIIDMATLTGAARIALGQDLPPYYTPNDALARELDAASAEVGDPVWRMPLWQPYRKKLKSTIADINNMASTGQAGSITAALFLHEFVKPFANWIHLDAYAWRNDTAPGAPKGGEASALRAVYRFLQKRYKG